MILDLIIFNTKIKKYFEHSSLNKIPKPVITLLVAIAIGIIITILSLIVGSDIVTGNLKDVTKVLVTPTSDRLGLTVAENRQPFFNEWAGSFGPVIKGIPIFFWLFFIGSVFLYLGLFKEFNKKEKWGLGIGYILFLLAIIFSRNSTSSILNGTNTLSILVYIAGVLILISSLAYYYFKSHKSGELSKFTNLSFGFILALAFFFFAVISARGAVRLIMMMVPPAAILVAYFVVTIAHKAYHTKGKDEDGLKIFVWIIALIVIIATIFAGYQFVKASDGTAKGYVPSVYTQQWQKAMAWVRDNTSQNAVFGHWWDYGYWVQSIGERATVLDGGNAISYWNHLMGRHALTGTDEMKALGFLYAHNTTHFLIDSTDIGKYSAFSTIGSNDNYDRASWISSLPKNNQQTTENKNSTTYLYGNNNGIPLDEDVIITLNGTRVFLPANKAFLGGITLELSKSGDLLSQPIGIFIYPNKGEYRIPFRYAFKDKFIDFKSGIESGVFVFTRLTQVSGGIQLEPDGALLYLTNRTVKSQLARLYFYKEDDKFFKLVHTEDDYVISQIKSQGTNLSSDFIYFNGEVRGPIRIWEINYPKGIKLNQDYLNRTGSIND